MIRRGAKLKRSRSSSAPSVVSGSSKNMLWMKSAWRLLMETGTLQHARELIVLQDRSDGQFHEVAPRQGKLSQGLRIIGFQQIEAAAEIGPRPASQELGSLRRLSTGFQEAGDALFARFGIGFPIKRQHEFHKLSLS